MEQVIVSAWGTRMKVLYMFLVLFLSGCGDLCTVDHLGESKSPNGMYVANIFERNCGATTPYVRVVSLRHIESEFDQDEYDDWVFTLHGQSDIHIKWVKNTELQISYSATGDAPTKRTEWGAVTISYVN